MDSTTEAAVDAGEPTGAVVGTTPDSDASPSIVDKRTAHGGAANWSDEDLYKRTPNRLSNVRWGVGEEPHPGVEGTSPDDPWVNVKLDVTEHAAPDPDQRDLLGGGVELKLNCFHCRRPLHTAAEKTPKEILEAAGYKFPEGYTFPEERVVACVCENGHVHQLRESAVRRLVL